MLHALFLKYRGLTVSLKMKKVQFVMGFLLSFNVKPVLSFRFRLDKRVRSYSEVSIEGFLNLQYYCQYLNQFYGIFIYFLSKIDIFNGILVKESFTFFPFLCFL